LLWRPQPWTVMLANREGRASSAFGKEIEARTQEVRQMLD
jgi:hypothetical protein